MENIQNVEIFMVTGQQLHEEKMASQLKLIDKGLKILETKIYDLSLPLKERIEFNENAVKLLNYKYDLLFI